MTYIYLWVFIIFQRLVELAIAKSNERWMIKRGAIIIDEKVYKWIVLTHVLFLCSLLLESYVQEQFQVPLNKTVFFSFILLQILRIWCLTSLGRFWNTKIIVLPKVIWISKGPYKYFRHPNYIVVGLEFIVISIMFHAYIVATIFPLLHLVLMYFRIPQEERALSYIKGFS